MNHQQASRGFTLIEILVVIAIIGILSTAVLANNRVALDRADMTVAIEEMRSIRDTASRFFIDTRQAPGNCTEQCDDSSDPFLNDLGVVGWRGPYMMLWNFEHPWGGCYSIRNYDVHPADGNDEFLIYLDDDACNSTSGNNSGPVPVEVLIEIDKRLDDGDLSTGNFIGNREDTAAGGSPITADGEGVWIVPVI